MCLLEVRNCYVHVGKSETVNVHVGGQKLLTFFFFKRLWDLQAETVDLHVRCCSRVEVAAVGWPSCCSDFCRLEKSGAHSNAPLMLLKTLQPVPSPCLLRLSTN